MSPLSVSEEAAMKIGSRFGASSRSAAISRATAS
jgi:hypothetical protein